MPPSEEKKRKRIEKSKVILVEGNDEVFFFEQLLESMKIQDVQVWSYEGKPNFRNEFPVFVIDEKFKGLESYAIFRDADDDPRAAFQSVRDQLASNQQPCPSESGTFANDSPRVGVYVIPDSESTGMLEDLCLRAVEDHSAMPCVTAFMECLGGSPKNPSKAKFHAFLAATHAGKRLGEAFKAGAWEPNHPALERVRAFLGEL